MKTTTIVLGSAALAALAYVVYKNMKPAAASLMPNAPIPNTQSTQLPVVTKSEVIAQTAIATALKNLDVPVALTNPTVPVKIVRTGIAGIGINPSLIL